MSLIAHFTDEETESRIGSFQNGKAGRKTVKQEWGGSRERKVGLVDRWGPFWILSEEVAFLLRPEWRKEASGVRIRGTNILEGTVRCKGTQSNGHTSLSTCGSNSP